MLFTIMVYFVVVGVWGRCTWVTHSIHE